MLSRARTILLADDLDDDRALMAEAFKEASVAHPVQMVTDGDEVVAYLERTGSFAGPDWKEPGLIILDLKMVRMGGFDALKWIRASERWKTLPVVILTASGHPGDIEKAYRMGANAFLTKPSQLEDLFNLAKAIKSFWLNFAEFPETNGQ